jgi:hypothetical protein
MIARHRILFNNVSIINFNRAFHYTRHFLYASSTNKNQNLVTSIDNVQVIETIKPKQNYKKLDMTFENSEIAYKTLSNSELVRGLFVFYTFSVKFIVDNQLKVCSCQIWNFVNY